MAIIKKSLIGILFLIIILLIGCDVYSEQKTKYYQFTPDELSHLYFNKDTLIYDGNEIHYNDTIAFLHNSTDTILVKVHTEITDWAPPLIGNWNSLLGISTILFKAESGFDFAEITVNKRYDKKSEIYINLSTIESGHIFNVNESMNIPLDTATVLGITYNSVYKFEYPDNSPSKIKRIYFAKKFGFIKVETADGRKLERLKI